MLCFCIVFCAEAQWTITKHATIQNFELSQISGLYKGIITDEFGYTWIASDNALYRFDGNSLTTFRRKTASRFLKDFYQRANGDLLVLHDGGLSKISTTADTAYFNTIAAGTREKKEGHLYYPKTIFEDQNEQLWISESQSVVRLNENGLTRFEFEDQDIAANLLRSISITEDGYGNLWAMTFVGNLFHFDLKAQRFRKVELGRNVTKVSVLLCRSNDTLMIGGAEGVFVVETGSDGTIQSQLSKVADIQDVSSMLALEDQLLIGTWSQGLYLYENDQALPYQLTDLPFNDIIDLHKASYGTWVMGNDQVSLISTPVFEVFEDFGMNDHIEAMIPGIGNELIVSSGNELAIMAVTFKGLSVKRKWQVPDNTYVSRIARQGDRLWVGTGKGTIAYIDLNTGESTDLTHTTGSHIQSMLLAPDGTVWACGNQNTGIIRVTPNGQFKEYKSAEVFDALTIDVADSTTFFGGQGRQFLHRWDPISEQFQHMDYRLSIGALPADLEVNDLAFDPKGIYLATSHGLYYAADRSQLQGSLEKVDLGNFSNASLGTIEIDKDGALWVAGENGLGLVRSVNGKHTLFNEDNGLPSRHVYAGGILLDNQKNVLVATLKGIGFIYNHNRLNLATPQPFIVRVRENGHKLTPTEEHYEFGFNSLIQIDYLSPSFPANGTLYRYRLNGTSDQWSALDPLGKISLFDLKSGNYTLEFQAKYAQGYTWSESRYWSFLILKPWHQKTWVRLLLVLLIVILIYLIVKLFNRRLLNRNKNLEALIDQKAEEIDAHKQEIIAQQEELLVQKEELLVKNQRLFETSSALDKAEIKYREVTQTQLEAELEFKNKQLTTHALHLLQKNKSLEDLSTDISDLLKKDIKELPKGLRSLRNQLNTSVKSDRVWDEFKLYFEQIHSGFYSKLKLSFNELSSNDLKHCALIKLNLNNEEASSLFGVSPETVRVSRFRIQKKLGLKSQQALVEFLMKI